MGNVLVTGGNGFIGYHLAHDLSLDRNLNVYIIDNMKKKGISDVGQDMFKQLCAKNNVYFIKVDLTDAKSLQEQLEGLKFDAVYHLAAINGTSNFYTRPEEVINNNMIGTISFLNCLTKETCGRFVYASSCEAYAGTIKNGYDKIPTPETVSLSINDIFNPRWSYGGSKIVEELYVKNYCTKTKIEFCILRYHNIYGIRDCNHVVPDLIEKMNIFDNNAIEVPIYGNDTRSFLYIDDCIEYTKRLGTLPHTNNNIYNVGIEKETFIIDLASEIVKILNKDVTFKKMDSPVGSIHRRCPDMTKTISATLYYPKINLRKGLQTIIDCYQKQKCII